MADASEIVSRFAEGYDGFFGRFSPEEDSDESSASASSPDGDNNSIVHVEFPEELSEEFENRKSYIMSKRKRLGPMGKLEEFSHTGDSDDSYGGILNFKLLGKSGGFFFYTARKRDALIFIQAYSTSGKRQIPEEERDRLIDSVLSLI